jgi:hypothetical protein
MKAIDNYKLLMLNYYKRVIKAVKFYALFGNTTTTLPDGTRQLVNSGTSATNGTLYSGQGLHFDGASQYITRSCPTTNQDFAILFSSSGGSSGSPVSIDPSDRVFKIEIIDSNTAYLLSKTLWSADSYINIDTTKRIEWAYTVDIANNIEQFYANGELVLQRAFTIDSSFTFNIGVEDNGRYNGIQDVVYFIPQKVDSTFLQQHYANPEQTLYRENGVLKSAFLPQATLDDMEAGNGFAYLMNENVSAGAYVTDICKPFSSNLIINGGFDTDTNGWFQTGGATITSDNGRLKIVGTESNSRVNSDSQPTLNAGIEYICEFYAENVDGSNARLVLFSNGYTENKQANVTYAGWYRFAFTPTATGTGEIWAMSGIGTTYFDNIRVYENTNLSTITNYADTMRTNAQALPYGYQNALVEQDAFGVTTGLASIDVKADDFADAQAQFLSENGLTLTDNAGVWEITK